MKYVRFRNRLISPQIWGQLQLKWLNGEIKPPKYFMKVACASLPIRQNYETI